MNSTEYIISYKLSFIFEKVRRIGLLIGTDENCKKQSSYLC